ncbi:MAG: LysR family transcriptional regulator [Dongiaceae bacterium]
MEVTWLQDFSALCSTGSFSRAAEQRHVTQPAFSRRIHALEEWMGVKLFDRGTHPIALTEVGRWFRPVAEDILRRVLAARQEAQAIVEDTRSTLHFAATHVLSWTFFPSWLRALTDRLPHMGAIRLVSDTLSACEELMLQERVQFLLCHYHPKVGNRLEPSIFQSVRVGDDTLVPVTAPENISAQPVPGEAIHVLSYSDESGLGQIVKSIRGEALLDVNPQPIFTSHLAIVLKTMAIEGRGIAWLPKSLILDELGDGRLVEAGRGYEDIPVEIRLFRRRVSEAEGVELFWRFFQSDSF